MTDQLSSKKIVSKDMTIEEILSLFPHKAQRLAHEITSAGLHCVGCHAATWETLEAGMLGHGMVEEDIQRLVYRLNALLNETSDPTTITITKRAAEKYLEILAEEGKQGWGLRLEERMAGCNGFEYALDYSEKLLADDELFESEGIAIHVKKNTAGRLVGSRIDYHEGLQGAGFTVDNPNAKSSCGCGKSYNY